MNIIYNLCHYYPKQNQHLTMKRIAILVSCLMVLCGMTTAQTNHTHRHMLTINHLQVKESLNYGLVFKGPGLGYMYSSLWENDRRVMEYTGVLSLNVPLTRGIISGSVNLVPARLDYRFKFDPEGKVTLGPYVSLDYNMMIYPDLQSGYLFWLTNYSLGGVLSGWFSSKESRFDLCLHFTVLGLTSRTKPYDNPYFFSGSFGELIGDLHSNLTFNPGQYTVNEIELRWTPKPSSRLAYGYSFRYHGYFQEPELNMINHSVIIHFLPKKDK